MSKKEGKTDFTTETQQNLMRIVEYMASDVMRPVPMQELQQALDLSYNRVLWALKNMEIKGWAENVADGWRLGPRLPRIAEDVRRSIIETSKKYLGEVKE